MLEESHIGLSLTQACSTKEGPFPRTEAWWRKVALELSRFKTTME